MSTIERELSLSWSELWIGVVAGIGIYAAILLLTRLFGQRSLASLSTFDFPVTVAVGAIVGRTALVRTSLLGGLVALATLFLAQGLMTFLRHHVRAARHADTQALLLVSGGEILPENLRRAHMSKEELYAEIRMKGACRLEEVAAAIFERSGGVSVLVGGPVDQEMLQGVHGAERIERVESPVLAHR